MLPRRFRVPICAAAAAAALAGANPAAATVRIWSPLPFQTDWHNAFNWNPNGVPTANDDVIISGSDFTVTLSGNTAAVNSAILSAGATLNSSGFTLNVRDGNNTGSMTLGSTTGTAVLFLAGGLRAADIDILNLTSGGRVQMVNTGMEIRNRLSLSAGGSIIGSGSIDFRGFGAGTYDVLVNNGTITAQTGTLLLMAPLNGRLNLSGTSGSGRLILTGGGNIDVSGAWSGPFTGELRTSGAGTFNSAAPWTASGSVNLAATGSNIAGATMTFAGNMRVGTNAQFTNILTHIHAPFRLSGGFIDIDDGGLNSSTTLRLHNQPRLDGGTITGSGSGVIEFHDRVSVGGNTTLSNSHARFFHQGTTDPDITIHPGARLTLANTSFGPAGQATSRELDANVLINAGTLHVTAPWTNAAPRTIELRNGGRLTGGTLTVNWVVQSTGTITSFVDAPLNVTGGLFGGTVDTPLVVNGTTTVSGRIFGPTVFNGLVRFTAPPSTAGAAQGPFIVLNAGAELHAIAVTHDFALLDLLVVGGASGSSSTLSLQAGLNSKDTAIASVAGATGRALVTSTFTRPWNVNGNVYVGGSAAGAGGSGTLQLGTLFSPGHVHVSQTMRLWPNGTLDFRRGILSAGQLLLDPGARLEFGGGSGNEEGSISVFSLTNDGRITASGGGTLSFTTPSAGVAFDLGGSTGGGEVHATGANISFTGRTADFGGTMSVGGSKNIVVSEPFTFTSSGTLNLNGGTTAGTRAAFQAPAARMDGRLNATGHAQLAAPLTFGPNAMVNLPGSSDRLELGTSTADTVTYEGGSFTGQGILIQNGHALVKSGAHVLIDVGTFNWDGQTGVPSNTSFEPGATMTINSAIGNAHAGVIDLDRSTLIVNSPPGWSMGGQLNINPTGTGTATVGGSTLTLASSATLNIAGTANIDSRILAQGRINLSGAANFNQLVSLGSTSTVNLTDNGVISFNDNTNYGGGTISGTGTIRQTGTGFVVFSQAINLDGAFDMDGANNNSQFFLNPNTTLALDVTNINIGNNIYSGDLRLIAGTIDLNTAANQWTMGGSITMTGALGQGGVVTGSPVTVAGSVSTAVANDHFFSTPTTFQNSSSTSVAGSTTLNFSAPAVYNGGTHSGAGALRYNDRLTVHGDTDFNINRFEKAATGTFHLTGGSIAADSASFLSPFRFSLSESPAQISINSGVTLAGQLIVDLLDDYIALPGNTFPVVTFGSRTGDFSTLVNETGFAGLFLERVYTANSIAIETSALGGDANLDGVVNLADFNRLAANFGATDANWLMGDFNGDGLVNLADFNILAANFGLSASDADGPTPDDWSSLAAAVPEPGVLGLSGVVALLALRRRRALTV